MAIKNIGFENPNAFIEKLAHIALSNRASDIHITPGVDYATIKFRIGGDIKSIYTFSMELFGQLLNSVKIKGGMDISEHNHIQDGRIFFKSDLNGKSVGVNLRVSTLPILHGENIVMRILLADSKYLDIGSLGFSDENVSLLNDITNLSEGLVLVCGGTGSGKTTTLYSILNMFDKDKLSIFTLEDPVEYQVEGYIQSQVRNLKSDGENASFSFEEGLVGILRQDPDVIMLGELRREGESKTCFEAANTGHLVLGTIHANNSISVVTRIRQFGIEPYLIASGLKYIVSQKIMKTLCPYCRKEENIEKSKFSEKFQNYIDTDSVTIYKKDVDGCENCKKGYRGITLVGEIIKIDDNMYNLIEEEGSETDIKTHLFNNGFIPYYIDGLRKCIDGDLGITDVLELEY